MYKFLIILLWLVATNAWGKTYYLHCTIEAHGFMSAWDNRAEIINGEIVLKTYKRFKIDQFDMADESENTWIFSSSSDMKEKSSKWNHLPHLDSGSKLFECAYTRSYKIFSCTHDTAPGINIQFKVTDSIPYQRDKPYNFVFTYVYQNGNSAEFTGGRCKYVIE